MDDKPLVSIIVLTYKDYSKLDDLLNSCFMQDYDNFEVIVRDDGSPNYDKELFMLKFENCPKKVNYEIVHDEKNKGTVINFNEAIKISKGKYIVVIAGDDTFRGNNVISRIVSKFEKENVMCVSARERHFWNDGREIILPSIYEESIIKRNLNRKLWYMISAHPCFIVGSATSYRRDVFEKYGFFNEKYKLLEDWPFYLKLLENGEKIAFLDCDGYSCAAEPPVQYRLSHLSRRSEPLIKHTICMMRIYSRNALSNPYTSRMEISCSASMLVMLMR